MRMLAISAYLCFSFASSWTITAFSDSIASRTGAADKCKKDCTEDTFTQGECTHLGLSDPCSDIACIKNVTWKPKCSVQNSGGGACNLKTGNSNVQTNHDMECSAKTGWVTVVIQESKPDCQPGISRNRKCIQACDGPLAFDGGPRDGPRCDN